MTSDRSRAANQANAKRSTGPKTKDGKAAASQNARRHGFAAKRKPAGRLGPGIESLALELSGPNPGAERLLHARLAAEATLELMQIRLARVHLITQAGHAERWSDTEERMFSVSPDQTGANPDLLAWSFAQAVPAMEKLERYERRAWSLRKKSLRRMELAR